MAPLPPTLPPRRPSTTPPSPATARRPRACCVRPPSRTWLKRNAVTLSLFGLGLLGLITALAAFLQPCATEKRTRPADVVVLLDGSGSLNDTQFELETQAATLFLNTMRSTLTERFQAGVVQWNNADPATVEAPLSPDIATVLSVIPDITQLKFGTRFGTALAACGDQLQSLGQNSSAFGACLMITDGENNIGSDTYTSPSAVLNYCTQVGLAQDACNTAGLAAHLKASSVTIVGVYVGDGTPGDGPQQLYEVTSCPTGGSSTTTSCPNFATTQSFTGLQQSAELLAQTLVEDVGSDSVCTGSSNWFLFLLLFLPLAAYLLYRPLSLAVAKARGPPDRRMSAPPPPPRSKAPTGTPHPNAPNAYRWSIKAADNYLWNMGGGGARALPVQFGDVAPPSAPKDPNKTMERRMVRAWEPPSQKDSYAENEVQPGDLDFELTMLILRCFPCLRPDRSCCPCLSSLRRRDNAAV